MNVPPTLAARKTRDNIGQEENLEKIRQAICSQDRKCQVILIQAEGGMGKTRLVEEMLQLVGHPDYVASDTNAPWRQEGVIVADLTDMVDVRLHVCDRFVQKLRNSVRYAGIYQLVKQSL